MKVSQRLLITAVLAGLAWPVAPALAQSTLVLHNSFISKHKNRVTIVSTTFSVDHVKPTINAASKDGDLHIAGRLDDLGLPLVIEITNARSAMPAVERARNKEGTKVPIQGVWRLWFEHATGKQTQGSAVPKPANSNPAHVFEVHPVTEFDGIDVRHTFAGIPGFTPKKADAAFAQYEKKTLSYKASKSATTIAVTAVGYNYVDFKIRLKNNPTKRVDGYTVLAEVFDLDGDPVTTSPRRMVFAAGTPPAVRIATAETGEEFRVLGIPRINLDLLSKNVKQNPIPKKPIPLPYEMIIMALEED